MKAVEKIIPLPLQAGDHAALIAAASPISKEALDTAAESLRFLGLKPVIMPSCECAPPRPWLAADDRRRAQDLTSALADPQIRGIFFARGGYGSARVAPYIDFDLFRRFPKVMLGSSDLTFLLNAVSAKSGLVTFHGPMPSVYGGYCGMDEVSIRSLRASVFGAGGGILQDCSCLDAGQGSGSPGEPVIRLPFKYSRIIGGNLTVLCSMLGTPYEPDFTDAAVFLEDVNEPLYKIDRMLTTLVLSGRLRRCAGIVYGSFKNCRLGHKASNGKDLKINEKSLLFQILKEAGSLTGRPVVMDQPFGHKLPSITFQLG